MVLTCPLPRISRIFYFSRRLGVVWCPGGGAVAVSREHHRVHGIPARHSRAGLRSPLRRPRDALHQLQDRGPPGPRGPHDADSRDAGAPAQSYAGPPAAAAQQHCQLRVDDAHLSTGHALEQAGLDSRLLRLAPISIRSRSTSHQHLNWQAPLPPRVKRTLAAACTDTPRWSRRPTAMSASPTRCHRVVARRRAGGAGATSASTCAPASRSRPRVLPHPRSRCPPSSWRRRCCLRSCRWCSCSAASPRCAARGGGAFERRPARTAAARAGASCAPRPRCAPPSCWRRGSRSRSPSGTWPTRWRSTAPSGPRRRQRPPSATAASATAASSDRLLSPPSPPSPPSPARPLDPPPPQDEYYRGCGRKYWSNMRNFGGLWVLLIVLVTFRLSRPISFGLA